MSFREIAPAELQENVFRLIGEEWLLVSASDGGRTNAMTASWGGMGVMWGKPVVFLFIRPQRYTKEFIDAADTLTVSVLQDEGHRLMSYFGSVSGRDEDKVAASGLHSFNVDGQACFEEARLSLICRKLYVQPLEESCLLSEEDKKKWYPGGDYHVMYVASVEKCLVKEQ